MSTPEPKKKGLGRKWFPPREDRGNYRFFKKWSEKLEVQANVALTSQLSVFVRPQIKTWLATEVGEGKFGFEVGETTVTFGFKTEIDRMKFERFLEANYK